MSGISDPDYSWNLKSHLRSWDGSYQLPTKKTLKINLTRGALLASRSTGPKTFGFTHCGRAASASGIFIFEIINHSQKCHLKWFMYYKANFCTLRPQGAHTANYYFGKVNFLRLSIIHISNTSLKMTI